MEIIMKALMGSHLYGLATPESDKDYLGVFIRPTREVLSFFHNEETYVTKEPDTTLHELKKFMYLAAKGNPTVLELLFVPEYEIITLPGLMLVKHREDFLSSHVRDSFGGYAYQQSIKFRSKFERMQKMFTESSVRELQQKYGEEGWLGRYLQDLSIGKTEEIILARCGKESGEEPFEGSPIPKRCEECRSGNYKEEVSPKEIIWIDRGPSEQDSPESERPLCNLWRNNARVYRPQSRNGNSSWDAMPEMQQGIRTFQRQSRFTTGSCELFRAYLRFEKNARHCFRLLRQGKELLETGTLNPVLSNPEEYFEIGKLPTEELVAKFTEEYASFKEAKSVLPDEPNWEKLDNLLLLLRGV